MSLNPDRRSGLIRVQALHALEYCERLFYLEEVEEVRVADAAVFAGRRLHQELADDGERVELELTSEALGITGKVDALRRRDGSLIVYEYKRGRPAPGANGPEAWRSDRIQVGAYALLASERFPGVPVEARVRYHQPEATVCIPLDDGLRGDVVAAITRANTLRSITDRPPITNEENRCMRCSLAPVCLPEEERLVDEGGQRFRLFPEDDQRQVLHVTSPGSRVGRSSREIVVTPLEGDVTRVPINTLSAIVLHGPVQVSSQALALCVESDVGVHWFTGGGRYLGAIGGAEARIHRRRRQFEALRDGNVCLQLARRLAFSKLSGQLRFLLRASRGEPSVRTSIGPAVRDLRALLPRTRDADSTATLRGIEGAGAARYFSALPSLLGQGVDERLRFDGRSRRPPKDRFNAILSFLYGLVHREVEAALLAVGLDPAFGFFHQPRTSAGPLALDLMEEFRVPLADMPLIASLNRRSWDPDQDFEIASDHVWLSKTGRAKAIELFERRKHESWKHSELGYALSYARLVELEARLLEKEWTGKPGLFATFRLR